MHFAPESPTETLRKAYYTFFTTDVLDLFAQFFIRFISGFSEETGQWAYALLAALEKPIDGQVSFGIREARSELASKLIF